MWWRQWRHDESRPRFHAWGATVPQLGGQPVCWSIKTSVKNPGMFTEVLITLSDVGPLWSFDALMVLWVLLARSRSYKLTVFRELCFHGMHGMKTVYVELDLFTSC